MSISPDANEEFPLSVLPGSLLESVRLTTGTWRFHFVGAELTAWGDVCVTRRGRNYWPSDSGFFEEFSQFWGCELSSADVIDGAVVLGFGADVLTVSSDDDGEIASLLLTGQTLATLWTREGRTVVRTQGPREEFDPLTY